MTVLIALAFRQSEEIRQFQDPRDQEVYPVVQLQGLYWFQENLRYQATSETGTRIETGKCGVFYKYDEAMKACPSGWRLPTVEEVKALIKSNKKKRIDLTETLGIELCGRIDYEKYAKAGIQNTFWLNEELDEGYVTHWHTFGLEHEMHKHNVIIARRQFPVRCVCEIPK